MVVSAGERRLNGLASASAKKICGPRSIDVVAHAATHHMRVVRRRVTGRE
jgi:hypothetical protein